MIAFMTGLLATFLRTFGIVRLVRPPILVRGRRPKPNRQRSQAARPAQVSVPPRLSPITSPTLALRLIADTQGQVSGQPRPANPRDMETAWMQLGDPIADYVKALIAVGRDVPRFLASQDEETQMQRLLARARQDKQTFIRAIWQGAAITISAEAQGALARRIERLSGGQPPAPVLTGGPRAERECHAIDSYGRPVVCRMIDHGPDGPLEILDAPGGILHRQMVALSCWEVIDGWLPIGGFRPPARRQNDGDGLPDHDLKPKPPGPKA